jgi:hypothetical protein
MKMKQNNVNHQRSTARILTLRARHRAHLRARALRATSRTRHAAARCASFISRALL